ncbi:MAG: pyridoxamine 5'-phosphate oxidase family protein [Austwickia sp.]|nr:MAG: pyridoxamine 5'-phosphate oxidase family protein [Austwickia sp.]
MSSATQDFYDFVTANPLGVVSTYDAGRGPEAALVDFAAMRDGSLLFGSKSDARKMANIAADARVAVVIGCCGTVTYQVEGTAEVLDGDERDQVGAEFARRFPGTKALLPGFSLLRVRAGWVRRWDSSTTPPTVTMVVPAPGEG